jgi:hypothetical protein
MLHPNFRAKPASRAGQPDAHKGQDLQENGTIRL